MKIVLWLICDPSVSFCYINLYKRWFAYNLMWICLSYLVNVAGFYGSVSGFLLSGMAIEQLYLKSYTINIGFNPFIPGYARFSKGANAIYQISWARPPECLIWLMTKILLNPLWDFGTYYEENNFLICFLISLYVQCRVKNQKLCWSDF